MNKNSKFERLIVFFKSTLEPPEHLRLDGLRYWQARIFYTLLGIGILLAFFALIPTAWIVIKANLWGLAIFDCSAFLLTVYIWRAHHVSFKLRAKIILLLVYSIGLWVILSVGILSGGPAWLFTFAILSGVFLGVRAAVAALFINVFTLATLAYFGRVGYLEISGLTSLNFDKVAVAGINFIFLNAVSAISMAGLMKGLKVTSQKERKAIEIIKQEREDLLKAKENLEEEIQIRLESEEKYRILAENVTDVIWTMDMDLNYTYINSLLRLN